MKWLLRGPIAPKSVDVNDGECAVPLFRYHDAQRVALIVYEIVRVKKHLPRAPPSLAIKSSEWNYPAHRVMRRRIRRPRPNGIGMEERHESLGVASVPCHCLGIDQRPNLLFRRDHCSIT